jgi:hypothetical protein
VVKNFAVLTVGCQISTLIIEFCFMEGGLYRYHLTNILMTAKFLPTWGFNQRYWHGLYLTEVPGGYVGKNFAVLNIFFIGYS